MPSNTLFSPDVDSFSTPPTTPTPPESYIGSSLSRKSSRPSNVRISPTDWNTGIVVDDQPSPNISAVLQGSEAREQSCLSIPNGNSSQHQRSPHMHPIHSPCFIHSHLDKGASLTDWIKSQQRPASLNGKLSRVQSPESAKDQLSNDYEEDEEFSGSLTAQLAETAVGVREMSKQLGRARVHSSIQNVLIVTKARDNRLIKLTRELALYLMLRPRHDGRGLVVYVDAQLRNSRRFDAQGIERDHPQLFIPFPLRRGSSSSNVSAASSLGSTNDSNHRDRGQLRYWTADMCNHSPHLFDFVATLGGDGTVLFTSWLFQRIVPPVLPFALGSLGFLTNFDFSDHQPVVDSAIDSGIRVNLRMRFTCTVYRAVAHEESKWRKAVKKANTGEILMRNLEQNGWEALEGGWSHIQPSEKLGKDKEITCFTTRPAESFEILNDLVVDRGPSPYVSMLELFGDDHHLTTVQADGLTISTPTGSTAYSLSAGGSLVHPEIPAILITPICPHTLSFRPMLLPDSMELRICVPFHSRSTAWASFDGRGRVELKQGDHIKVTASKYPFPTVCADKQSTDWFHAISRTLKWNERERQKSFVMVEEGPVRTKPKKKRSRSATPGAKERVEQPRSEEVIEDEEDEVTDEEEEDDKFDIDDLSSTETDTKAAVKGPVDQVPQDDTQLKAEVAAAVLSRGNPFMSRTSHSKSGIDSGVDSPDRFIGPHPQPPRMSSRHVTFTSTSSPSSASLPGTLSANEEYGARDDIHSARSVLSSARSKIPRNRDPDPTTTTPTPRQQSQQERLGGHSMHGHHRGRSGEHHPDGQGSLCRAFAVWGQDESGSSASDSDA